MSARASASCHRRDGSVRSYCAVSVSASKSGAFRPATVPSPLRRGRSIGPVRRPLLENRPDTPLADQRVEPGEVGSLHVVVEIGIAAPDACRTTEGNGAGAGDLECRAGGIEMAKGRGGVSECAVDVRGRDLDASHRGRLERQSPVDVVVGRRRAPPQQLLHRQADVRGTGRRGLEAAVGERHRRVDGGERTVEGGLERAVRNIERDVGIGDAAAEHLGPIQPAASGDSQRLAIRAGALDLESPRDVPGVAGILHPSHVQSRSEPPEIHAVDLAVAAERQRLHAGIDGADHAVADSGAEILRRRESRAGGDERLGKPPGHVVLEREQAFDPRDRDGVGDGAQVEAGHRSRENERETVP